MLAPCLRSSIACSIVSGRGGWSPHVPAAGGGASGGALKPRHCDGGNKGVSVGDLPELKLAAVPVVLAALLPIDNPELL